MMRFTKTDTPDGFATDVGLEGTNWLRDNPIGRPPSLWRAYRSNLSDAFRSLCAYSAMYEPVGTVDHFVCIDEDRSLAYEWSNYRYAAQWINSCKRNLGSADTLDPFDVVDDWFEILLPSLQLVVTDQAPVADRVRLQSILSRLHLDHDERVVRQRRAWYSLYQRDQITLAGLLEKAPLLARAIQKQIDDANIAGLV